MFAVGYGLTAPLSFLFLEFLSEAFKDHWNKNKQTNKVNTNAAVGLAYANLMLSWRLAGGGQRSWL